MVNCEDKTSTCVQDCSLITQTFEKAANSDMTEEAALAVLYRGLEAMRTSSKVMQTTLGSYALQPDISNQASSMADSVQSVGASAQADTEITSAVLGGSSISLASDEEFSKKLLEWAKDCIPCVGRMVALTELVPGTNILDTLKTDIQHQLDNLSDFSKILGNFKTYSNYCDLLAILSGQCVPDLQKMIALIMALFMQSLLPELDLSLDAILQLVAPLFQPIFTAITTLLDQFVAMVVSPIDCIITALQLQIEKAKSFQQSIGDTVVTKTESASDSVTTETNKAMGVLEDSITQLQTMLTEARDTVQAKLYFYIDQLKALLGDAQGGFQIQLNSCFKKIGMVRMIAFIASVISAISSGNLGCSTPEGDRTKSELDNFVDNFLNPNSSYQLSLDSQGNLVVDEVNTQVIDTVASWPKDNETLPNTNNVVQFDGSEVIDLGSLSGNMESWVKQMQQTQTSLTSRIKGLVLGCKLQVSQEEGTQINQWISDLNKAGAL